MYLFLIKRSSSTHLHDQATTDSDDAATGQDLTISKTAKYLCMFIVIFV